MNEITGFLRLHGTVGRGAYALAGFTGFAIKYYLDRLLASSLGARGEIWNYWIPFEHVKNLAEADARQIEAAR